MTNQFKPGDLVRRTADHGAAPRLHPEGSTFYVVKVTQTGVASSDRVYHDWTNLELVRPASEPQLDPVDKFKSIMDQLAEMRDLVRNLPTVEPRTSAEQDLIDEARSVDKDWTIADVLNIIGRLAFALEARTKAGGVDA